LEAEADIDLDEVVVVAIGGNLPGAYDSVESLLEAAVHELEDAGLTVAAHSPWWRSAAWPDPSEPPFLNAVLLVRTDLNPAETLEALHAIERRFGRERSTANAPRTLDLDLIAHGRTVTEGPGVTLPHPRAHERRFVMGPLAQIAPGWTHPSLRQTAENLATSAEIGMDAAPIG
jgi:2-amino-4-hydroxy-6-hydroxymethyldihydropteridine diphosphokinase